MAGASLTVSSSAEATTGTALPLTVGSVVVDNGVPTLTWANAFTIDSAALFCLQDNMHLTIDWAISDDYPYMPGEASHYDFDLLVTPVLEDTSTNRFTQIVVSPGFFASTLATQPQYAVMPSATSVYALQFGVTQNFQSSPDPEVPLEPRMEAFSDVRYIMIAACDPEVQDCDFYFARPESTSNNLQQSTLPMWPGTITPCEVIDKTLELITNFLTCPDCGAQEELDFQHRISEQVRFATEDCGGTLVFAQQGNGASWYKIYAVPSSTQWGWYDHYVSWSLVTNSITNGADDWAFGIDWTHLDTPTGPTSTGIGSFLQLHQHGNCDFLTSVGALGTVEYFVDAGAGGWTTSSECSVTLSWEMSVGLKVSVDGPETSYEAKFGGSHTCGDGSTYDAESLLMGESGAVGPPCLDASCIL